MSDINDFKDLRIWQKGMDIAEKCYFQTPTVSQRRTIWDGSTD